MVNGIRFSQSLCSQLANLNMEYVFFSVFNQIAATMGNSRRFLRSVLSFVVLKTLERLPLAAKPLGLFII